MAAAHACSGNPQGAGLPNASLVATAESMGKLVLVASLWKADLTWLDGDCDVCHLDDASFSISNLKAIPPEPPQPPPSQPPPASPPPPPLQPPIYPPSSPPSGPPPRPAVPNPAPPAHPPEPQSPPSPVPLPPPPPNTPTPAIPPLPLPPSTPPPQFPPMPLPPPLPATPLPSPAPSPPKPPTPLVPPVVRLSLAQDDDGAGSAWWLGPLGLIVGVGVSVWLSQPKQVGTNGQSMGDVATAAKVKFTAAAKMMSSPRKAGPERVDPTGPQGEKDVRKGCYNQLSLEDVERPRFPTFPGQGRDDAIGLGMGGGLDDELEEFGDGPPLVFSVEKPLTFGRKAKPRT